MKKFLTFILVLAMVMSVSSIAMAAPSTTYSYDDSSDPIVVTISSAKGLEDFSAEYETEINGKGKDLIVNITANIDMAGMTWNPIYFNSYPAANPNTIKFNGNGYTISNLNNMLFSGTWTGKELTIQNLTLDKANISKDVLDSTENVGVGAFIGNVSCTETVNLINCKLTNSAVEGGHWTGGLIGYSAGYSNQGDGPVFTTITVENCEVTDSAIKGKGSVGGIAGHATGDSWTTFSVVGGEVSRNKITSNGSSQIKAGDIFGTIGAAGTPNTTNRVGKVEVNTTAKNNEVTSNGTTIDRLYGRYGTPNGVLQITGGEYDTSRENNSFVEPGVTKGQASSNDTGAVFSGEGAPPTDDPNDEPTVTAKPSGSGISVKYNGGNSFSTSNPSVPTGVEIDGVPVTFNGTGSNFTVGCISSDAKWVTVRWNSTSVTTNFTPDGLVECTTVSIPKTGDMSFWAAVAAFFGF